MNMTELAERYFASVRARDIEAFVALFAQDAVFIRPDGRELVGIAAIREMELGAFNSASPPTPHPKAIVASENAVAAQVQVTLPGGIVLHMANFFHLNGEGLIQRLSIYRQGG